MVSANGMRKRQSYLLQDVSQSSGFCTQYKAGGTATEVFSERDVVEGPRKKRRQSEGMHRLHNPLRCEHHQHVTVCFLVVS